MGNEVRPCWVASQAAYHIPSFCPRTKFHLRHAFLGFCVDIDSKNLGESSSNPKLKFLCNVMHPSYGQGRDKCAMAPDEDVIRRLMRFDVVTV